MLSLLALKPEKAANFKQNRMSLEAMTSAIAQDLQKGGLVGHPETVASSEYHYAITGKIAHSGYKKYHIRLESMHNEVCLTFNVVGFSYYHFDMFLPCNIKAKKLHSTLQSLRSHIENNV